MESFGNPAKFGTHLEKLVIEKCASSGGFVHLTSVEIKRIVMSDNREEEWNDQGFFKDSVMGTS